MNNPRLFRLREKPSRTIGEASHSGFTLIELVLAMVILVIVMTVAYGGLRQIIEAKKMLDDNRDADLIGNAILERMTRELQLAFASVPLLPDPNATADAVPTRARMLATQKKLDNGEQGDSVTFIALEGGQYLPDGGTHSGLVQLTYRVEKDPDAKIGNSSGYALVREEVPYILPAKRAREKAMVFPITRSLVGLELYYFDSQRNDWVSTWGEGEEKSRLPRRVMFGIKILTPNGRVVGFRSSVALRAAQ